MVPYYARGQIIQRIIFTYYPLFVRYNHGAALLSALCCSKGVSSSVEPLSANFFSYVKAHSPEWISFSFVTKHDYQSALPYAHKLRAMGYRLMCGGVYCRKDGHIEPGLFEEVCRGEGEILPDFLLTNDRKVFKTRHWQDNITNLSRPDYSIVKGDEFHRGTPFLVGKKIYPYSSSRGCPFNCSFCETKNLPAGVRIKLTVQEDLEWIADQFNPDLILFLDECIPYYMPRWMLQMVDVYQPFACYIRADISEEALVYLIHRGLKACAFGVESGDESYRNDTLMKGITDEDINRTTAILNEHNVDYVPFFMTGTPGETSQIREKTMNMFQQIGGFPICWEYEDLEVA